ncbi:MAG: YlxR family protein [Micromonosporaceae bacterium]
MVRRAYPVRTCVGCRNRAPASELLRVVAVEHGSGFRLVPDHTRRRPGRGAHVHPDPACLAKAERRRAFGRALRVPGVIDTGSLRDHVDARSTVVGTQTGGAGSAPPETAR